MRILYIPLESDHIGTNDRHYVVPNLLARENELIGLKRPRLFGTDNSFLRLIRFFIYSVRVVHLAVRSTFDVIMCEHLIHYALIGVLVSLASRRPVVWDGCSNTYRDYEVSGAPTLVTYSYVALEKLLWSFLDIVIVGAGVTKDAYVKQGYDTSKIVVVPLSADLSINNHAPGQTYSIRRKLGLKDKRVLIFAGATTIEPNMRAVTWINERLASEVSKKVKDAQILIAGGGPIPPRVHPIVKLIGYVPNLLTYITMADVFIAPLNKTVGIPTKVVDAMACGKPVVVTRAVSQTMPELVDELNAMIANDEQEFIEKTCALLLSTPKALIMGINARKTIESSYNWDRWFPKLVNVLQDVCQKAGNRPSQTRFSKESSLAP